MIKDSFSYFTQDKSIKAHRIVLSACSSFFKAVFQDVQAWQHSVVFLKERRVA
jgi:hypothetical protein